MPDRDRLVLLLLGRQGSGKGTQAVRLALHLQIPWVSTGEMFRQAAAEGAELGLLADGFMKEGKLVPDEVTIGIVRERLAKADALNGAILDGFPRTRAQAEALDTMLGGDGVDLVLNIEVPVSVCRERMIKRIEIEGRPDDTPEAIDRRLALYEDQTEPLLDYYGEKVVEIDGLGSIDEVFLRCVKASR